MFPTSLLLLLISTNLVLSATYQLEPYYGYIHNEVFQLSQAKCLSQCSMDSNCCAFSFIIGVANECHIYRNCSQIADFNNVDIMKAYYKKDVVPTTPKLPTTIVTTPEITSTTTTQTTTTPRTLTTTNVALAPIPEPHPPAVQVPAPAPAPVIPVPEPAVPAPQPPPPPPPAPAPAPIPCPIFSYSPCKSANKEIFQSTSIVWPFNIVGPSQWNWCSNCKNNAKNFPLAQFDQVHTDVSWKHAITYRRNSGICDLIVECNLDHEYKNFSLYLNGVKRLARNFWVRITFSGGEWVTTWDGRPNLPATVYSIECK